MTSNPIRYRYAVLLIWAAVALVGNPVLHAFSHDHAGHLEGPIERVADIQWTEQDLCPYCDAVSQFIEPSGTAFSSVPEVFERDRANFVTLYPDLRLRLSTRLRAPPGNA